MPFLYRKVVVIGATSGIGLALAERIIQEGSFVIAVGRRRENLEKLVHQHGHDKVQAVPFDISKLAEIPHFVKSVMNTHQDVDCVILNSGIQRKSDFSEPESIDMDVITEEFTTNYLAQLGLTKAFLPYLQEKKTQSALVYVTSTLALVPFPRCANYCATKAALHQFLICLREQVKESPVEVVELCPPAVQTELHDEKHQPDMKNGRSIGMPIDQFTEEAYQGLVSGAQDVPVGFSKNAFEAIEVPRQKLFSQMLQMIKATASSS